MAMTALTPTRSEMMTRDDWARVSSPWRVVEAAATDETARDAAVIRIIDTMLQLQLEIRHQGVGFKPHSTTGNVPMPGGGRIVDQVMLAAEHYHPESAWHKACAWMLDQIPRRQAAAMMLQAARIRPDRMGSSIWMVTASQIVERQSVLLRALGMSGYMDRPFESVEALQIAARRARNTLRGWLSDRLVRGV